MRGEQPGAGRRYYGWPLLFGVAVAQVTSWGLLYYGFAVFVVPLGDEFGWSRAAVSGAFSAALFASALAGVPIGRWLDRHGPRLVMTAGSCAGALLLVAASRVTTLWAFYLVWIGIGLALGAVLYEPAFWIVANWFSQFRGRALTILTFIGGFASVVYLPVVSWLVRTQGWRGAFLGMAALLALGTIPIHALLLRRRPQDLGLLPDGATAPRAATADTARGVERSATFAEAVRGGAFWWLTAAFFLANLAVSAIFVHLIAYLIERGYSPAFAATTTGAIGVLGLPGRLVFTPLGSWLPRRWVSAGIFCTQVAGLLALLLTRSTAGIFLFVALFGMGFGAITPARAALLAEFYGPAHYGRINGLLAFAITCSRAIAPIGAGLLYTLFGGYESAFWVLTIASAVAAGAILLAEPGDVAA
jgi:MFS family permease